ncbi:hypothetical protein ACJJIF_02370 [Microbulbifer sp. SSSA002]|uniref:hypothetical protein n=1 Tax=Microbulbifer sp. SSSA002 TaxID=3243376 RepID=UPI00403A245A
MKKVMIGLSLVASSLAFALPEEQGDIGSLQIHQDPNGSDDSAQRFILKISGATISENNCGADQWTGYLNTDADKASYSTLLALLMANKPVKIQGTSADTCMGNGVLIRNIYPAW